MLIADTWRRPRSVYAFQNGVNVAADISRHRGANSGIRMTERIQQIARQLVTANTLLLDMRYKVGAATAARDDQQDGQDYGPCRVLA